MKDQVSQKVQPPRGFKRLLWRAPIWFYRLGLGGLLGGKFLLLKHTGRKSGQPRQAVIEIDDYDPETNTYLVASGFGRKSDWYQNILKSPEVTIQVGRKQMQAVAEPLSPEDSGEAMVQYAKKNPKAARNLTRLLGHELSGTEEEYRAVAEQYIPFVALRASSASSLSPQ